VPTDRDLNDRPAVDDPPALAGEAEQPTARDRFAVVVRQHENVAAGAVAAFDVQPLGAGHAEAAHGVQVGQPADHRQAVPPHVDELDQPPRPRADLDTDRPPGDTTLDRPRRLHGTPAPHPAQSAPPRAAPTPASRQ
jgi:hypothetical protein